MVDELEVAEVAVAKAEVATHAATTKTESSPKKPVYIDRYLVKKGLGAGAMASVYLAEDAKMNRPVAIKVLAKELSHDPKAKKRFSNEAKAIAKLKHPNIVKVFDVGELAEDFSYLVMEYVDGEQFSHLRQKNPLLPEKVLVAMAMELGDALEFAHQAGIIHRDLKPENVFLAKGRVVLVDFGIAKAIDLNSPSPLHPKTDIIGTPGFMAPEQLQNAPLTCRTDIFSFGALFYFLATGIVPFKAPSPLDLEKRFKEGPPRSLHELRPDLGLAFCNLVMDCLELDPALRPPTMRAVWARLKKCLLALKAARPREVLRQFTRSALDGSKAVSQRAKNPTATKVWLPEFLFNTPSWLKAASATLVTLLALWFLGRKAPDERHLITVYASAGDTLYIDGQPAADFISDRVVAELPKKHATLEVLSSSGSRLPAARSLGLQTEAWKADFKNKRLVPLYPQNQSSKSQ